MFELTKLFMLAALMICMVRASDNLTELDNDSLHSWVTAGVAFIDFFVVLITGLILVITASSNDFPQEFSVIMTIAITVEFVYMLFVYGKVIPDYEGSKVTHPINKNKEIIKID